MVKMYTGTPGSGKSYHAAKDIQDKLRQRKNVISTMAIDTAVVTNKGRRKTGIYEFHFIQDLTPKYLIEFAMRHHRKGKEGQTVIVIDECQIIFNSREYSNKGRAEWIIFFSMHRHYGYDIILITQQDRMLDRQIRGLVETEYKHRKINNRGILFLLPVKVFAVIEYWYATASKARVGAYFVRYRRSVSRIYNSYEASDVIAQRLGVDTEWQEHSPAPAPTPAPSPSPAPSPAPAPAPIHPGSAPSDAETGAGGSPSRRRRGLPRGWWKTALATATVKY